MKLQYDRWGRMKYCQELHFNQGKSWTKEDEEYLIEWYDKIGPDEMSFALGRTIGTIMTKVGKLRNQGYLIERSGNKKRTKKTDPPASKVSQ